MKPLIVSLIAGTSCFAASQIPAMAEDARAARSGEVTKLTKPACKTAAVRVEGGDSEQVCTGPLRHKLLLLDSDGRMSVTVVTPNGAKHPLNFTTVVTSHFSAVGDRARWRFREEGGRKWLISVIIPLEVKEDPESSKVTPFWIVARVSEKKTCVVQSIRQTENSLQEAQRAADEADKTDCSPEKR